MEEYISSYLPIIKNVNIETGDFPGPFLTISRQSGCSAQRIAIKLSKILTGYSYMAETKTDVEWKWVNKNIFSSVVKDMIDEVKAGNYDDSEEESSDDAWMYY